MMLILQQCSPATLHVTICLLPFSGRKIPEFVRSMENKFHERDLFVINAAREKYSTFGVFVVLRGEVATGKGNSDTCRYSSILNILF